MKISEILKPKFPRTAQKERQNFRGIRTTRLVEVPKIQKITTVSPMPFSLKTLPAPVVYEKLIQISCQFVEGIQNKPMTLPELDEICEAVERVLETINMQLYPLLELTNRSTPGDYLPAHNANVTILSLALAQELEWPKEKQRAVGVGAFLHDAAISKYQKLYSKEDLLTAEEKKIIQNIPKESFEMLNDMVKFIAPESRKIIENILLQSHERISGKGAPNRLKGEQISKEAQVVGLADTYEAMTHPRPYRKRKLPHDALRAIIELAGDAFDGNLIKDFWETLSLFPPGSYVRLSSGEIAKVVSLNKKNPTSPIVKAILSPSGEKVNVEKIIDLSQNSGVSIEKAVDECSLRISDLKLTLKIRAQKWWLTKGN